MTGADLERAAGRPAGVWTPLTSFVGRTAEVAELGRLLAEHRLVTVTGPGGVGKTRLAIEVARGLEDQFPDGVWFAGLATVADEVQVPTEVMAALGVRQDPGLPPLAVLAEVLAPRRLLLVLDNCEHVLPAVTDLCRVLLADADEVRVLATSRERLGMAGEQRYRLAPLELPDSDEPEAVGQSAAAALFAERARQADPRFTLTPQSAPLVARVVARLDGMPLAIELAAARVEALGMAGLADRIDDGLRLLTGRDLLATDRHKSLAAVADWSYQLLAEPEQQAFRRLAVFPGPFTLEAAEAVIGPEAGPIVLRLASCSLLMPPQAGADGRTRSRMLQILRAYALTRLQEADQELQAMTALVGFAMAVAKQAGAALATRDGELDALRWLDAEDATLTRALSWALDHDPDSALHVVSAVVTWLRTRRRAAEAGDLLRTALARSSPANPSWARAQVVLGYVSWRAADLAGADDQFTAVIEAYGSREPSHDLVVALVGRTTVRLTLGDDPATVHDASRALTAARDLGDPAGELLALTGLSLTARYAGDSASALNWARQAEELLPSDGPAHEKRWCLYILATTLTQTGELDAARRVCAAGLTLSRQADDVMHLIGLLTIMVTIERRAGNAAQARAYLSEVGGIASRNGDHITLTDLIDECGYLCAETGRWTDAVTLWAAHSADRNRRGLPVGQADDGGRTGYLRRIEQAVDRDQLRVARERGARMTISAAAELAIMITSSAQEQEAPEREAAERTSGKPLSPRERELITLVAQGHTNAQIADRLFISVRTVASHLDRIRDKTGYRRRADLTRLALEENLI